MTDPTSDDNPPSSSSFIGVAHKQNTGLPATASINTITAPTATTTATTPNSVPLPAPVAPVVSIVTGPAVAATATATATATCSGTAATSTALPSIRSFYSFPPSGNNSPLCICNSGSDSNHNTNTHNNNNGDGEGAGVGGDSTHQTSVLPSFAPFGPACAVSTSASGHDAPLSSSVSFPFSTLDTSTTFMHPFGPEVVPSQTRPITAPASLPSHPPPPPRPHATPCPHPHPSHPHSHSHPSNSLPHPHTQPLPSQPRFPRSTPAFVPVPLPEPNQPSQQGHNFLRSYVEYQPQYFPFIQRSSMSPPDRGMSSRLPKRDPTGRSGRKKSACERCRRRRQNCSRGLPCDRCTNDGVAGECSYAAVVEQQQQLQVALITRDRQRRYSRSSPPGRRDQQSQRQSKRVHRDANESPGSGGTSSYAVKSESNDDGGTEYRDASSPRDLSTNTPPDDRMHATFPTIPPAFQPLRQPIYAVSSERTDFENPSRRSSSPSPERRRRFWQDEHLLEEHEAEGVGSRRPLRTSRGSQMDPEQLFFGTSHFGPQLAATVIEGGRKRSPVIAVSDVRQGPAHGMSSSDDTKPYTLCFQRRELFPLLPTRKEQSDRYVRCFFERYNAHIDILYKPDYDIAYNKLWTPQGTLKSMCEADPRQLGLVFIVLAFGVLLEYDPKQISDRRGFVSGLPLAEGAKAELHEMVDELEVRVESLAEREERSKIWEWAAQRALNEPSKFFGESVDTVRAWALIALYMVISRRVPEAWTAVGQAVRNAQALGMHVDGSYWDKMTFVEVELNRRLWAQLYTLDRSVSLFLGRPLAIQDGQMNCKSPSNLRDDELDQARPDRPLDHPTKTTFLILHQRLCGIIGNVQLVCFGLQPRKYEDVIKHEAVFQGFKNSLPPHFRLDGDADESLDTVQGFTWLIPQRKSLISKFHLARISLHRPYLLRSLSDARYAASREACLQSAIADIQLRTAAMSTADPLERFKWMTVASGFNPATIIGILCVWSFRDHRYDLDTLLFLLEKYIAAERRCQRRDEQLENELRVLDMMVDKAKVNRERERHLARDHAHPHPHPHSHAHAHVHGNPHTHGHGHAHSLAHPLQVLTHSSESNGPTPPTGFRHDTDATLYSSVYNHPVQSPLDGLMGLPAMNDPTGPGMPDSGDLGAWAMVVSDPLFSVGGAGAGDAWYGNDGFSAGAPWAETAWVG